MDLEPLACAVLRAVGDPASFGDAGAFGCAVAEAGFYWLVLVVVWGEPALVEGELLAVVDLAECLGGLAAAVVEAAEIFVQRAEVCLVDLEV